MPALGPIKRRDLIRNLRKLGFTGPYWAGEHQIMVKADVTVRIPNPHRADIGRELLLHLLHQAGVQLPDWERL